jgi:hypothetical protein
MILPVFIKLALFFEKLQYTIDGCSKTNLDCSDTVFLHYHSS